MWRQRPSRSPSRWCQCRLPCTHQRSRAGFFGGFSGTTLKLATGWGKYKQPDELSSDSNLSGRPQASPSQPTAPGGIRRIRRTSPRGLTPGLVSVLDFLSTTRIHSNSVDSCRADCCFPALARRDSGRRVPVDVSPRGEGAPSHRRPFPPGRGRPQARHTLGPKPSDNHAEFHTIHLYILIHKQYCRRPATQKGAMPWHDPHRPLLDRCGRTNLLQN